MVGWRSPTWAFSRCRDQYWGSRVAGGRGAAAHFRSVTDADFAVAWTATSCRAVARVPVNVVTAPVGFIYGSLAENPRRVGKPPTRGLTALHSASSDTYRRR
jgi:mRNA interferase RelE/StbE